MKPFDWPSMLGSCTGAMRLKPPARNTTPHRPPGWQRSLLVCLAIATPSPPGIAAPDPNTGYLAQISDRSGTTSYTRDPYGRIIVKRQTLISGLDQQVRYGWGPNTLPSSITYPNGSVLGYRYDPTGRLIQLDWNGQPIVTGLTWNPMGQPTAWTWAFVNTGLPASRTYDTAARLVATEFSRYIHDPAGRIKSIAQELLRPSDADPNHASLTGYVGIWNVTYDPVGRITGFNANNDKAGFSYDANGNRTASTRVLNGQSTTRNYTVESTSNKLLGFTQTQGATSTNVAYGYNPNGDLTSDGLRTFSYNAEGRLSAATTGATDTSPTTRYAHNALGQRVFKTEPLYPPRQGDAANPGFMQSLIAFFTQLWAPSTSDAERLGFAFMYDEAGTLLSETGTGGANSTGTTNHIYLPTSMGPMPIAVVINGVPYAVHSDHLNTPRKITNAAGQVVWQWAYSAFGEDEPTIAAKRFTGANTVPKTGSTSIAPIVYNLRMPGQYFDAESGLAYNYFRSYDSRMGRYTQPDPIGLQGGSNRFGYVLNNPLRFIDPDGLQVRGIRNPQSMLEGGGGGMGSRGGSGWTPGMVGAGAGAWIGTNITGPMLAKPPENAYDPNGPKAPGKPGEAEGFRDPKGGPEWVRNPNGRGYGWKGADGGVWCPTGPDSGSTGDAHGGPHWDVEYPGGRYENIYPGGRRR